MKILIAPATTLVVSQPLFLPPSYYRHRASRPFKLGFYADGTGPYWPNLGVDLSGDVAVNYYYDLNIDFEQTRHEVDLLNGEAVGSVTGLWGGEYFNYVVRAKCTDKIVFG